MQFLKNYIKSMRLYYAFVTFTAGYAGIAVLTTPIQPITCFMALSIMFIGWGVNQIINDYMNQAEDKINAADRPMVTGALPAKPAVAVSAGIILSATVYSVCVAPMSVIPLLTAVFLNIIYARAKAYGMWGNIIFGCSISCCAWYTYTLCGGGLDTFFRQHGDLYMYLVILNAVMTYFTCFKDYTGDKAAHVYTPVVQLGLAKAGLAGAILGFVPVLLLGVLLYTHFSYASLGAFLLGGGLFVYTGYLFYKHTTGDATYFNLKYNFAALSACQATIVSFYMPITGLIVACLSVVGVITIFTIGYKNVRA